MKMVIQGSEIMRELVDQHGPRAGEVWMERLAASARAPQKGKKAVVVQQADDEEEEDAGNRTLETWHPMLVVEARGCEVTGWDIGDGYRLVSALSPDPSVKQSGATVFEDVDLDEGDWAEYDEAGGDAVDLMGPQTRVVRVP
jgi:hypothetical protein